MHTHLALAAASGLVWIGMTLWGKYRAWVWYDNLAHFLAGACLFALASIPAVTTPTLTVAIALAIALAWELFEWLLGIHPWAGSTTRDAAWEDTALDMVLVLCGAIAALWVLAFLS